MIRKIYSQNVHKNTKWTQHLLETLKDTVDIIMIQEPPRYHVKNIPSGDNKEGTPEHDTCHHAAWSKIYFHTNVSVYINQSVLKTHNLFLLPPFDNNIIAFTLQLSGSNDRHHFINCYNDNDQPTLERLLSFIEREDLPNLTLMGDFNLHSPEWDVEVDRASVKAKALADKTAKAGLFLLNDNDKPTWTQPGKTPSVLDLVFVHFDLLQCYTPTLSVDLENRVADHAAIVLEFNDVPENHDLRKVLPQGSREYERFIDDATEILKAADVNNLAGMFKRIADAFEYHSLLVQSKTRQGWWTQACSDSKAAYRLSRSEADKARWYNAMKKAKNTFFNKKIEEAAEADDIWGLLKWKQPRPPPKYIQLTDNAGNPIQDTAQVFNTFHQHFNGSTRANASNDSSQQQQPRPMRAWHDFTTQDIRDALKTTSVKSAPGPDRIGWAILKHLALHQEALEGVLRVVHHIILSGEWPQVLKESITVVIQSQNAMTTQ
jgi:hypothetical protein